MVSCVKTDIKLWNCQILSGKKNETGILANFMPKRDKKKCQKSDQVSLKLGQLFETMDSFSETGLKLSMVSAETEKIIR